MRHKYEKLLLSKLYDIGILGTEGAGGRGKLSEVEKKVTVSSMCRRRLGVVMTRLKMADTVQAAIKFIEQGYSHPERGREHELTTGKGMLE